MKLNKKFKVAALAALIIVVCAISVCAIIWQGGGAEEIELPILMYHHLDEVGDNVVTISRELFAEHLDYLAENGYETVNFDDIIAYANGEDVQIPEKPVAIVFDDGYQSNYKLAFPELQKRGDKATICVIGSFVGCSTYKDTGAPMLPYFSWETAREMVDSGLVKIASHTYDMHQYAPLETGEARESVKRLEGESDEEFQTAICEDYTKMQELFATELGKKIEIFAYPNGVYDSLTEETLRGLGAKVTFTTRIGMNHIVKGDPESLYLLRRYSINQHTDLDDLQRYLDGKEPRD